MMGLAEAQGSKAAAPGRWCAVAVTWRDLTRSMVVVDEMDEGGPTRSHEGHMVRVVGGVICM